MLIYFATFGGFIALTAWLPKYWQSFHGIPACPRGNVDGAVLGAGGSQYAWRAAASPTGWVERALPRTSIAVMLAGSLVMVFAFSLPLAVLGAVIMAIGMGVANAAVFKLVPQHVPQAVGGAAGWVGGLGAFGGFVIPNLLALFVGAQETGDPGYARGFVVFAVLAAIALVILAIMGGDAATKAEPRRGVS